MAHHVVVDEADAALMTAARASIEVKAVTRRENYSVVVDLCDIGGRISWPRYAQGPSELLSLLAAEQRYLAEEVGAGTTTGRTYLEKAQERRRRWRAAWSERS